MWRRPATSVGWLLECIVLRRRHSVGVAGLRAGRVAADVRRAAGALLRAAAGAAALAATRRRAAAATCYQGLASQFL